MAEDKMMDWILELREDIISDDRSNMKKEIEALILDAETKRSFTTGKVKLKYDSMIDAYFLALRVVKRRIVE